MIKTTRPNGTQQLRHYDVKGQLLQQQDVFNQTVITQFDYRYDAVGNIIEETKQPVNIVPNLQLEMTYAAANQLATVNQQAVELNADGNMINGILKGQFTSFSFDSRNRLTQAGDTTYRYDAEDQRIGINQTQLVVNSQPALSQVLVRTKGNGEVTYYVYGLGLIGEERAGNYFSYHFDYRGSTVALTDNTGQVVDRVAYSAYGELLTQPTHDTPFLFNGMYGVMSDDNGLYYMRARFYSPEIKRFVNQDVLLGNVADGQSLNRFVYTNGRPITFIDPYGLVADYVWDIPVITYDIYYGIKEGDWTPLGIDLPLAIAPFAPAGAGILACGTKRLPQVEKVLSKKAKELDVIGSTQPELHKEILDEMIDAMKDGKFDWEEALKSDGPITIWEIDGKRFLYNGNHRFFGALKSGVDIPANSIIIIPKSKSDTDIPTFLLENMDIVD